MKWLFFTIFALIFCGCGANFTKIVVLDLKFEQNATILPKFSQNLPANGDKFLKKIFDVWDKTNMQESADDLMWAFRTYLPQKKYYGESKLLRDETWFSKQLENANFSQIFTILEPAIITQNTIIRDFATNDKLFLNPKISGEGYPFDYLQESILPIFTPVLVSHFSKDLMWAFVKSDSFWGFVPSLNVKILSQNEAADFKGQKFGVFIRENQPILSGKKPIFSTRIGGIFPYIDENKTHFISKNFAVNKADGANFLPINDKNLKGILNELLGQNYGWGGENFLRDCSLFTKDFFAAFGIWLPRNSSAQGKMGEIFNLQNLTNKEKLEWIKVLGVPNLTLLYMPGHIMIYGGQISGEVVVIHDAWGLRTKNGGRAMIGKIAITSLEIGKNNDNIDESALLLSRITKMSILAR